MAALLALVSIVALAGSLIIGEAYFKMRSQKKRDDQRHTYELTFPQEVDSKRVVHFLRVLSGSARRPMTLTGSFSTVYEVHASQGQLRFFLRVPHVQAERTISQLHLIPGVAARKMTDHVDREMTYAVEVGMRSPSRPLDIHSIEEVADSILKSVDSMRDGQRVIIQLVLTPMPKMKKPDKKDHSADHFTLLSAVSGVPTLNQDELNERREKLEEPNFYGVLRVGAVAKDFKAAKRLTDAVRDVYAATATHANFWTTTRFRDHQKMVDRVVQNLMHGRSVRFTPGIQLSATEVAALIGWPVGGSYIAGLPAGRSKYLAPVPSVQKAGIVFGDANFPGHERPIAISVKESCKHIHLVGRTGSGKSTVMEHMAGQAIGAGRGLVLVDPKFDLFEAVANDIPASRIKDVVVFDVNDFARPVGFNLLSQGTPQRVASDLQGMFDSIYRSDGQVRMPEVLYHVVMTLLTSSANRGHFTFVDIVPLLWPGSRDEQLFSKAVIDGVTDPYIKSWWAGKLRMSKTEREKYFQPLHSRIWQLNSRPEIRNIIGQGENTLDMRDIVLNKKILLVNLKGLPQETAALLGSSIVNNLRHAIREGGASEDDPFHLFLDEFQNFVHMPVAMESMLAESRSDGLSITMAHQGLDQLDGRRALQDAVMNNAVNKSVFQRGLKDARTFAAEFGTPVTDDDMKKLGQFEFMAKVSTGVGISPAFTGITRPPLKAAGLAHRVRATSRERYGKTVADVESEIAARRRLVIPASDTAPETGDEEWIE